MKLTQEANKEHVFRIIALSDEELNATEIERRCYTSERRISKGTVYRALKELQNEGRIKKKSGRNGKEIIYFLTDEKEHTKYKIIKNLEERDQYLIRKDLISFITDLYTQGYYVNEKEKVEELLEITEKDDPFFIELLKNYFFDYVHNKRLSFTGLDILMSIPDMIYPLEIPFDSSEKNPLKHELKEELRLTFSMMILRIIGVAEILQRYIGSLLELEENPSHNLFEQPFQLTLRYTPNPEGIRDLWIEMLKKAIMKDPTIQGSSDPENPTVLHFDYNELINRASKAAIKIDKNPLKYYDVFEGLISYSTKELSNHFLTGCRNPEGILFRLRDKGLME